MVKDNKEENQKQAKLEGRPAGLQERIRNNRAIWVSGYSFFFTPGFCHAQRHIPSADTKKMYAMIKRIYKVRK